MQAVVQLCSRRCQQMSREAFKKVHNCLSQLNGKCADSAAATAELSLSLMGETPACMDLSHPAALISPTARRLDLCTPLTLS